MFERISVVDQIRHMALADVLIAPHGAGLSNIVFMTPRSCLYELVSPYWQIEPYMRLAKSAGLLYMRDVGEGVNGTNMRIVKANLRGSLNPTRNLNYVMNQTLVSERIGECMHAVWREKYGFEVFSVCYCVLLCCPVVRFLLWEFLLSSPYHERGSSPPFGHCASSCRLHFVCGSSRHTKSVFYGLTQRQGVVGDFSPSSASSNHYVIVDVNDTDELIRINREGRINTTTTRIDFQREDWYEQFLRIREFIANTSFSSFRSFSPLDRRSFSTKLTKDYAILHDACVRFPYLSLVVYEKESGTLLKEVTTRFGMKDFYCHHFDVI